MIFLLTIGILLLFFGILVGGVYLATYMEDTFNIDWPLTMIAVLIIITGVVAQILYCINLN